MFFLTPKTEPGRPYPLGATMDDDGVNFSLYSKHAEKVVLCLFSVFGESYHIPMDNKTDDIWHVYVKGAKAGQQYGYRVYGPYEPEKGNRFNHHKLLLDPYAKLLTKALTPHPSHMAYIPGSPRGDLSFSKTDSAPFMSKCVVVDERTLDGFKTQKPKHDWSKTIIYETHLKGFTIKNPGVPEGLRGTFAGMSADKVIKYLTDLGITSVELLPIAAFYTPNFLAEKGLTNYWGYEPICYMAPHRPYLASKRLQEIQTMVYLFHEAGIEVILDVVCNHAGEGSEMGPTICYRGIDNQTYYRLSPDQRYYQNETGCGNCMDLSKPPVLQLVMNSLRYWTDKFDVDGFRFDLASTLARNADNNYDFNSAFFHGLRADPLISKTKLIMEPWDLGIGGYQLGNFPSDYPEWNGRFRDTIRNFWRGEFGHGNSTAWEFLSSSFHPHPARHENAYKKINFITAHDGFTLNDLVSYNCKHNEANGECNRDGNNDNASWNSGVEGPTKDTAIKDFRFRRAKAMMTMLLLANGVPMMTAGDEMLRTQKGNNNAYCQDDDLSWVRWGPLDPYAKKMRDFVADLIKLRKENSVFSRPSFLFPPDDVTPIKDRFVVCLRPDGTPMQGEDWTTFIRAFSVSMKEEGTNHHFFLMFNATEQELEYNLPDLQQENALWVLRLDTSNTVKKLLMNKDWKATVPPWSVVVLMNQEV